VRVWQCFWGRGLLLPQAGRAGGGGWPQLPVWFWSGCYLITTVNFKRLEKISDKEYKRLNPVSDSQSSNSWDYSEKRLNFKSEIDVRGKRADEALQMVRDFIDDAIVINMGSVRILHGKGDGILRQLIRQYLDTVNVVKSSHDEHIQFGGSGITVVEFE